MGTKGPPRPRPKPKQFISENSLKMMDKSIENIKKKQDALNRLLWKSIVITMGIPKDRILPWCINFENITEYNGFLVEC